jgi:hypothetical protein
LPYNTLNYLKRQTINFAAESPLYAGGTREVRKAYVPIQVGQQDYNLLDEFKDLNSGQTIREYIKSVSGTANTIEFEIKNVFHYSPVTLYRFYDPYSSINLLSQEFNFESFNTETIFYVLPLWNDILRAMQLNLNDKVRRSTVSYMTYGDIIRIYPKPLRATYIWIEYSAKVNPYAPTGSLSADPSIQGISNISNVPFRDIKYNEINSAGKYWIRQHTFALCVEELGRIRRKFSSIPIPNGDVALDGAALVSEGFQLQQTLEDKLRADLELLTNVSLAKQELEQMQLLNQQLRYTPSPIYMM